MSFVRYELGQIYLLESHDRPNSRLIAVRYMRIESAASLGTPPLFILPSGPDDAPVAEAIRRQGPTA